MTPKACITFLLPGDNLSGGVRVTAIMGNLLRVRGYDVRVAVASRWHELWANRNFEPLWSERRTGWLRVFSGPVLHYRDVNALPLRDGEIVVGVGTYMIPDLLRLAVPGVIKLRQHHGFPAQMTAAQRALWSAPLPTITVSPTLVPELERLSGERVLAVVPNGVDLTEYFPAAGVPRDAIGTIYSVHPNKAPADILELLRRIAARWPDCPQVVFSTEPRPAGLPPGVYLRQPSVPQMRELYSRAQIWLLASLTEGLPAPVLEAMACGAVVVSTDNDGSAAVIRDGENGLLVPRGDLDAFLDRIALLRADAALRARLVAAGHETTQRFDWDAAAARMDDFLASLRAPVLAA